jgi:type I restriction enzyme, S subunit
VKLVKLKDICEFEKGSIGLAKAEPGEYPLVATGVERKTSNAYQFDTKAVCIPLVSSTGHGHASLKNVHYQEGKFALGSILVALTAKDEDKLDIQFLHLYLSQLKDQVLVPLMSGAANVALSVAKIQNIEIPLPSLENQQEIVRKFKSIVREEDELKSELNYQQNLLKKLRQQILQEAIEGKLTADWRAANPDVEPASELLKRIAAGKAQLIKDKKIKPQNPLAPNNNDEKPFDLPESWVWCRLGDISINSLGKMLDQQKNKGIPKPYLRNLNVQWHQVNTYDLKEMRFEDHETEKYTVKSGDIVICEGGYPGQAAIWRNDWDVMFQKALHRVRFISSCFDSELFVHLLWLWDGNGEIQKYFTGAGIKHLTGKSLNRLLIPLPPLVEQQAIVAKIEKLFALCGQLETQFNKNQCHAEQLMQAVLKEAFSHDSERQSTIKILEEVGA